MVSSGFRRHHHDYHQLIYVSTGVLAIHTEQGAWVASRDRAVLRDRLRRAHAQPLTLPAARDPCLSHACELAAGDLRQPRSLDWLAREVSAPIGQAQSAEYG